MTAEKLATDSITPLSTDDSVLTAIRQMEELNLAHLPVVSGNEYLGLVSERQLQGAPHSGVLVGELRLEPGQTAVSAEMHILELLRFSYTSSLSVFPVTGGDNRYLGAILPSGLLRGIAELCGGSRQGSILVVEAGQQEFLLSSVVQLVEANGAHVLNAFVIPLPESGRVSVTLQVDVSEIGPLQQAFYRLGYAVTAAWSQQDTYTEGLQERFDALMNYLSI